LLDLLQVNHAFLVTCNCFRMQDVVSQIDHNRDSVVHVTYPWNNDNAYSGIPPHVALLQEVTAVKQKQERLVGEFIQQMTEVLQRMGVDGGRISDQSVQDVLEKFQREFLSQIGTIIGRQPDVNATRAIKNGRAYEPHYYAGSYKRVPFDWRFPRCGVSDLWRMWWIGDGVRNIPPLKHIQLIDVKHIDKIPLSEEEKHGRTGIYKDKRRPSRKILADLKYIMNWTYRKVVQRSKMEAEISLESVDRMYMAVVDCFSVKDRDAQKRWVSVVQSVRKAQALKNT
jgi:hypothetical protein